MGTVNKVTITDLESKALKYNKPIQTNLVKYAGTSTVSASCTNEIQNNEVRVVDATTSNVKPISRILTLEKKIEDLEERVAALEELYYKVLNGSGE